MSGGETKLSGPDLTQGVRLTDIPEGGTLLGHAEGEPVLVVRRKADVFAVGATCTHYGGPLAEGLVVGDEVRCPWHHACFSLRTGDAVGGPALNPIMCFDLEEKNGRVVVLGKRAPSTVRLAGGGPSSVVIVGAGAAGNACAEALRREGYSGPIAMVGAEATGPVDRPNLSKDYLAGNAPEEWMPLRGEDFYREREIALTVGARVTSIDTAAKRVVLEGGKSLAYGALVLATGAQPARLPIPGADGPNVYTLRTLADSRAIIAKAKDAKRAVVIGAGFIGLEVAASLRTRGLEVHVVGREEKPLAHVFGDALAGLVRKVHEDKGVVFHLQASPRSIEPGAVVLESGDRIEADFVVMGVGVKPDVALAEQAGLKVDRGIVVDGELRASAPSVWAAGDVARFPHARSGESVRVEHWVVAERMGQVVAKNILGGGARYEVVPFFWSAHFDLVINLVGHAERWDRVDISGSVDARDAAVALRRGDRTLAVATVGRDLVSLRAEAALERGDEAALRKLVAPA
jgi:NADPH-dependent 2,4-dienoyl-CoA reductase/sulfur reductase-like enzyme/nitrite reductase/ring-hydroxylating ferredoxin subunit